MFENIFLGLVYTYHLFGFGCHCTQMPPQPWKRPHAFIINDTPSSIAFTGTSHGKRICLFVLTIPVCQTSEQASTLPSPPAFDLALETSDNYNDPNMVAPSSQAESQEIPGNITIQVKPTRKVRNQNSVGDFYSQIYDIHWRRISHRSLGRSPTGMNT